MKKSILAVLLSFLAVQFGYVGIKLVTKYKTPSQKPDIWWRLHNYWWPPIAVTRSSTETRTQNIPPAWLDGLASSELWAQIEGKAKYRKGPIIKSKSAFIYDVDQHQVLWSYNADARRPVASTTKLMGALALSRLDPNLDSVVCLNGEEKPDLTGASSKFKSGNCATGWDLLGAALLSSDNGAAMAFPALVRMTHDPFVVAMNQVAEDIGMTMSSFVDPAGLSDDNLSTARDMTRAILASSLVPAVSHAASAKSWWLQYDISKNQKKINSTNRLRDRNGINILAVKTGYTHTARHCLTMVYETQKGRTIAFTQLGAFWNSSRWKDAVAIMNWVDGLPD